MPKRSKADVDREDAVAGQAPPAAQSDAPFYVPEGVTLLRPPQKKYYRQRAHANVFSDHNLVYPTSPETMDWSVHFPDYFSGPSSTSERRVEFADVGCGFGGLIMSLAPQFPETLMLGMEIRQSVTAFVNDRIAAFRQCQDLMRTHPRELPAEATAADGETGKAAVETQNGDDEDTAEEQRIVDRATRTVLPGAYKNVSVIRANAMKHLPNFFAKAQLSKIFFLFPDPHFKRSKHKARIVTTTLLAEYAYVLRPGGILYTVTDVKDLHDWMMHHLEKHPLFEYIPTQELLDAKDPVLEASMTATEEGQKVARNKGSKYAGCFRRREDPVMVAVDATRRPRKVVRRRDV